ncbi:MAG TPA: phytanoyl-CoA dioxygenase family protein [Candidatus Dormibacteraeota bacterium]|jgi:hypothetical protein|nr:phytanoyl-CoA dioxygenase family protein [Candidatus Dormibacteraeota bacterium]
MLSESQRDEFSRTGLLRLPGALPVAEATEMCDRIWQFMAGKHGIDRDDPSTWTVESPTGFNPLARSGAFAGLDSPTITGAVEDLVGGPARRRERGRVLVTFPETGPAWCVPSSAWHFDYVPLVEGVAARPVQLFAALNDVGPRGGGTMVLTGSHRLVAMYIEERGDPKLSAVRSFVAARDPWVKDLWHGAAEGEDGVEARNRRYMDGDTDVDGVRLKVVELTGGAGDVYVMHSDCFHAKSQNCAGSPRIMLTGVSAPAGY